MKTGDLSFSPTSPSIDPIRLRDWESSTATLLSKLLVNGTNQLGQLHHLGPKLFGRRWCESFVLHVVNNRLKHRRMAAGSKRTFFRINNYFKDQKEIISGRKYFVPCQNCVFAIKLDDAGALKKQWIGRTTRIRTTRSRPRRTRRRLDPEDQEK